MTLTPADIVNQATQLIGGFNNNGPVTGTQPTFDGSPLGIAAGTIYDSVVQVVSRQWAWDFSRNTETLVATGNTAPAPWLFEYFYPDQCVQIRQVFQSVPPDPNDPLPINWTVGNATVAAVPKKVVWTNQDNVLVVFSNQPPEALWDSLFQQAVIRLLASELAMAVESKPESAAKLIEESAKFEQLGEGRDN